MYTIKKHAGEGSRSSFYKLNQRGKGFKTFLDRQDAEYARDIQIELSQWDLAPRVYSEIGRIRIGNRLSAWGYITEVAKVLTPHGAGCECDKCYNIENECEEEIGELQERIERAGYYFGDCHVGNVGYIIRNRKKVMVCIDTGEESISPLDEDYDENSCNCYQCQAFRKELQNA